MLSPTAESMRLFIHVLAASIWVGGQIVLAGVVPVIRSQNRDLLPRIAEKFARVSWPAFVIAFATGIWNMVAVNASEMDTSYQVTLFVKIAVAMASGVAALIHSVGHSRIAKGAGASLSLLAGLLAMFLGVLLGAAG
jgi:putative copper export protein